MKFKKIFILFILVSFSNPSYASQSVEEIIKGRKAMFSENYQNGKKISILLKSKKITKIIIMIFKKTSKKSRYNKSYQISHCRSGKVY